MKNKKTLEMVQLAVLIAIILIMALTPLGFLRTAGLEISMLAIPVVIGAMTLGPGSGALLGMVFGFVSFYQCFGMSAFGATLLGINPLFTFIVCVPTRTLMGFFSGLLFQILHRIDRTKTVSYFVTALLGAFLNTLFFMGTLILCFGRTEFIGNMLTELGGGNALLFVIVFVGMNGLLELPLTCIAGGAVAKALAKTFRKEEAVKEKAEK